MTDLTQATAKQFHAVESLIWYGIEERKPYVTTGMKTPNEGTPTAERGIWLPTILSANTFEKTQDSHSVFMRGPLTSGDITNPEFVPNTVLAVTTRGSAKYITKAMVDGTHISKVTRRLPDGSEQTRTLKRHAASLAITKLAVEQTKAILDNTPSLS